MDYINEPLMTGKKRQMKNKKARKTVGFLRLFLTAVLCVVCFLLGRATSSASDIKEASSIVLNSAKSALNQNSEEVFESTNYKTYETDGKEKEPSKISASKKDYSKADAKSTDWNLIVVNPWNKIPDKLTIERTMLKDGHSIDKRAYPDLQEMMDACRAEGLSPTICSSFRTMEKQQSLFNRKINYYISQGYSNEAAEKEAAKWVAVPGTSEHQLGLAVDIISDENSTLDESQEKTSVQQWLIKNSYKYGFILRYPSGKSDITGIGYEPWHYRYVGREAAKEIYERGICLEEYVG